MRYADILIAHAQQSTEDAGPGAKPREATMLIFDGAPVILDRDILHESDRALTGDFAATGDTVLYAFQSLAPFGASRTTYLQSFDAETGAAQGPAVRAGGANARNVSIASLDGGAVAVGYQPSFFSGPDKTFLAILPDGVSDAERVLLTIEEDATIDSVPVTALDDGNLLLAWNEKGTRSFAFREFGDAGYGQIVAPDGRAVGEPIPLHDLTVGGQGVIETVATQGGGFLSVAVDAGGMDGDGQGVFVRAFDTDGEPLGPDRQVNGTTALDQRDPAIVRLEDGRFVVVYASTDIADDDAGTAMHARYLDAAGRPAGPEFRLDDGELRDGRTLSSLDLFSLEDGGFAVLAGVELDRYTGRSILRVVDAQGVPAFAPSVFSGTVDLGFQTTDGSIVLVSDPGLAPESLQRLRIGAEGEAGPGPGILRTAMPGGETLRGTAGDDLLDGSDAANRLVGGSGDDTLLGAGGDDILVGAGWADLSDTSGGQVYRIYQATLGRAPDAVGFDGWVDRLESGTRTVQEVVTGFVASAEFQRVYGTLTDRAFVTLLYENVLGRAPDTAGLNGWLDTLSDGAARETVVVGFSESPEFRAGTSLEASVYIGAPAGRAQADLLDDVFRLYGATLDREPDAAGLDTWSGRLAGGESYAAIAAGFTNSGEFTRTYGALDDRGFIDQLYRNVLDRGGDGAGVAGWLDVIEGGGSREDVVRGFAQSAEYVARTTAAFEAYAGAQGGNTLAGGAGDDMLASGYTADVFLFDADEDGRDTVLQLDAWDALRFRDFGYDEASDALARMSASGPDVRFEDQGVTVVFAATDLATLQEVDFLFV